MGSLVSFGRAPFILNENRDDSVLVNLQPESIVMGPCGCHGPRPVGGQREAIARLRGEDVPLQRLGQACQRHPLHPRCHCSLYKDFVCDLPVLENVTPDNLSAFPPFPPVISPHVPPNPLTS